MIVHDIVQTENDPCYRTLEAQNLVRQYDFTHSVFQAAQTLRHPGLSHEQLRALNFHAIACLHKQAGEYRAVPVYITNSDHRVPPPEEVAARMDEMVTQVATIWATEGALELAAFVLWRLNWVHPFVNGNGRTARAAAYFTLCQKLGYWLPGTVLIPELIRRNREPYYAALRVADAAARTGGSDLSALSMYLAGLLREQLLSAFVDEPAPAE